MKWYSRSRADFLEILYLKYNPMEEKEIWCLWIWESITDYQLCNGDIDLLPTLYRKDEIRFEYNQWNQDWSRNSCTIFAAIWMLSDLINYEFSLAEIKEVDELSYQDNPKYHTRTRWGGWYVKDAVDLVADWYNNSKLSDKYWKVAYYRISKYDNEIIENAIDKLYTIDWNHWLNSDYTKDKADWMIDGTKFGTVTNWHSVDIINYQGQRSVKNSYKGVKNNIYWLKNKLSQISNFGSYFYIYTLVKDWALEDIKRLNEFKTALQVAIELNSKMWHMSNDTNFKWILHYTNDKLRAKVKDCDNELKKYQ